MIVKKPFQHLTVVELLYHTTRKDYNERMYEIEIEDDRITNICESTVISLYNQLGEILKKGGAA